MPSMRPKIPEALIALVVSTDDEEIKQVALAHGAEVPFKRPAHISEDVPTEDVALHAVNWLKDAESYLPDIVVCLEPPVPFRRAEHIDRCVEAVAQNDDVDSAITVVDIRGFRPEWMVRIDEAGFIQPYTDYFTRRGEALIKFPASQEFEKLYKTSGVVFSCRTQTLVRYQSFVGKRCLAVEINPTDVFDLDYPEDFDICEMLMRKSDISC